MKVVASGKRLGTPERCSDVQCVLPKPEDNLRRVRRRKKILLTDYCESINPDAKASNAEKRKGKEDKKLHLNLYFQYPPV